MTATNGVTKCHKVDAIIVLFMVLLSFSDLDSPLFAQTNQTQVSFSNLLPSNIVTTDGQTYKNAKLLRVLADGLLIEYLNHTQDPCEQANKYYDELTDHGRNYMDSDQAVQMAIHRYEFQSPN